MSLGRKLYWALVAATLAVYAAIALWFGPQVSAAAEGSAPFDARFGYDLAEAQAFLTALGDAGRAVYLVELRLLDTLFPVLLALTLLIAIFHLSRNWPLAARLAALVLPVAGAAFDLMENAAVAEMLRAGPEGLTPGMVADASLRTSLKWLMDLSAGAALVALLFVRAAGRLMGPEESR